MSSIALPPGIDPAKVVIIVDLYHGDNVNFHALVAAGVSGVILKATQGATMVDPRYHEYVDRAKSVGLMTGAYHFYVPTADPSAQADNFLSTSNPSPGDILPSLDSEIVGANVGAGSFQFAQKVHDHINRWGMVYSGDAFYQQYLKKLFAPTDARRWIARYSIHKPVTTCDIWQFSEKCVIPNEPQPLDAGVYFGSLADFKARMLL